MDQFSFSDLIKSGLTDLNSDQYQIAAIECDGGVYGTNLDPVKYAQDIINFIDNNAIDIYMMRGTGGNYFITIDDMISSFNELRDYVSNLKISCSTLSSEIPAFCGNTANGDGTCDDGATPTGLSGSAACNAGAPIGNSCSSLPGSIYMPSSPAVIPAPL